MINSGKRWRALRESLKMDQLEFAGMIGTSRATISRVENDQTTLRSDHIARLEEEIGMPVHQALLLASIPKADWTGEYLKLDEKKRAAVDEIITATISAIKTIN